MKKGVLQGNGMHSEACVYTILWSEVFRKEEIPDVVHAVAEAMGPAPTLPRYPVVGGSGLFIGLCIRLDLLAKLGEYDVLLRDIRAIFEPQLKEGPGTLWENQALSTSSRCHGFTSHTAVHLLRDLLGLDIPQVFDLDTRGAIPAEEQKKRILQHSQHLCGLRWMRGCIETDAGILCREADDR